MMSTGGAFAWLDGTREAFVWPAAVENSIIFVVVHAFRGSMSGKVFCLLIGVGRRKRK
jgi:hypothetical protein